VVLKYKKAMLVLKDTLIFGLAVTGALFLVKLDYSAIDFWSYKVLPQITDVFFLMAIWAYAKSREK